MKDRIKAWLGIDDPVYVSRPMICGEDEIRKLIGKCFVDALNGKADNFESQWYVPSAGIKNSLRHAIKVEIEEVAEGTADRRISERIYTEGFIDEVVERINRKQT